MLVGPCAPDQSNAAAALQELYFRFGLVSGKSLAATPTPDVSPVESSVEFDVALDFGLFEVGVLAHVTEPVAITRAAMEKRI